jgi:dolichyl-phosphate beta-glucosyltransferase
MPQNLQLSVVIPAYNEQKRLLPTLKSIAQYLAQQAYQAEVIIVDDGSTDATWSLIHDWCQHDPTYRRGIRLPQNQGKGAAVKAGMLAAQGCYGLMMDADGSANINQVERLWPAALEQHVPVVIGSRARRSTTVTIQARWYRHLLGRLFHQVAKTRVHGIADTQCGFKLFNMRTCRPLFERLKETGYTFDIALLQDAQTHRHPIEEVPVDWCHVPGSKVTPGDVFRALESLSLECFR